jgi:hypothetical protein
MTLVIASAVAIGIRAHTHHGPARPAAAAAKAQEKKPRDRAAAGPRQQGEEAPPKAEEKKPAWSTIARGVGENAAEAEEVALNAAADKVHDYLVSRDPAVRWTPTPAYVRAHLLKDSPQREPIKPEEAGPGLKYRVEVRVEVPAREYEQMLAQDREYRKEQQRLALAQIKGQRMLLLGRLLAGLVTVFAAVAFYLRLDDATQGAYKRWLRLAVVGFAGAIGAGLWLFPFLKDRLAE